MSSLRTIILDSSLTLKAEIHTHSSQRYRLNPKYPASEHTERSAARLNHDAEPFVVH